METKAKKVEIPISYDENYGTVFNFQWHITERCNLRCSHCYQESYNGENDMTFDELKNIADKIILTLNKWKRKGKIAITGGEPFVRKDMFPILRYLVNSHFIDRLYILTNGILINEQICQEIKGIPKITRVQVSLDGACPESHDAIRGKGTFIKALEGIRLLRNYGIKVNIMFTLQKRNMSDIPSLMDLAIKEEINSLIVERFVPCGSGKLIKDEMLSTQEIREVFQYISDRVDLEYDKGNRLMVVKQRPLWINIDSERGKLNTEVPIEKQLGGICSIGFDNLTILHDGTVLPCRRLDVPIGNLKYDSLFKIWYDSEILWQMRNKKNLKGKCNSCEFIPLCSGCRAMAYACTGDFLEEDPHCWK